MDDRVRDLHGIDAGARSRIYRLLSMIYKYPTPEYFAALQNGEFVAELRDNVRLLRNPEMNDGVLEEIAAGLHRETASMSYEAFETEFVQTFEVGAPKPPCPPYEGFSSKIEPRNAVMLHLAGFYKHFGLSMNQEEGHREMPDHLGTELEFMHFLAFKEAQGSEDGEIELTNGYVLAQRDFLKRHPGRWVRAFSERIESSGHCPVFSVLGGFTADFVEQDLERMNRRIPQIDPDPDSGAED